ncbi:MAG: glycosyltransferase family 9 protein [Candidatus Omnitrophota bacterium]|nr:glycosyltransferase family 9 protein [Candidatus Omnitrophota bacterium]
MKYTFKKNRYKLFIPLLDIIGSVIFFPAKLLKPPVPLSPKKILVVRLDHIGDFICTTPLFKNLKNKFPDAKITVLINSVSKELAYRNPYIDKVITFSPFYLARNDRSSMLKGLSRVIKDIKALSFDIGIDSRGDLLSILLMWLGGVRYRVGYPITGGGFLLHAEGRYDRDSHIIDRNLSLLEKINIQVESRLPEVYFNDKDISVVNEIKKEFGPGSKKSVVLHPFAGAKAKEWPIGNFQKIINWLKENGYNVFLVGSKEDAGIFNDVIDLRGGINLPQLAYLIKDAGFFIGLDSGPANIAAALNVSSVIICSGTNIPQLWIQNSPNVKFVYKDTKCKPCENKICPEAKTNECMTSISVEEVIDAVKGLER